MRLSIIIPAYNVAPWIVATLQSIGSSEGIDLTAVETIVVNDGSTDDTPRVVQTFIEAHHEMCVRWIQQENQGVSAARNNGLQQARGEYVWFVDGDDMISRTAVRSIFSIMDLHPGVDVIKTAAPVTFFDAAPLESLSPTQGETIFCGASELLREPYSALYICHVRHIWRRELLTDSGIAYPAGIVINEDFCFTIRALLRAQTACDASWLQAYLYRRHGSSATDVRRDPTRFMPRVESGLKALQMIRDAVQEASTACEPCATARRRVLNLMTAMNITHLMDPLPLSFVRKSMRVLEEMGVYPFIPEPDHSRLLRFVLQHKWAIVAVSQIRRLRYKLNV